MTHELSNNKDTKWESSKLWLLILLLPRFVVCFQPFRVPLLSIPRRVVRRKGSDENLFFTWNPRNAMLVPTKSSWINHSRKQPTENATTDDNTAFVWIQDNQNTTTSAKSWAWFGLESQASLSNVSVATKQRTVSESLGVSVLGASLALGILYTLAAQSSISSSIGDTGITSSLAIWKQEVILLLSSASQSSSSGEDGEQAAALWSWMEDSSWGEATVKILDVAIPSSATDVVTGALGEAAAGIAAAISSFVLSLAFNTYAVSTLPTTANNDNKKNNQDRRDNQDTNAQIIPKWLGLRRLVTGGGIGTVVSRDEENCQQQEQNGLQQEWIQQEEQQCQRRILSRQLTRKAVADGDFLVSQAVSRPILGLLGVPQLAVTVGSVLLASVPAEIVNVAARRRIEKDIREQNQLKSSFSVNPLQSIEGKKAENSFFNAVAPSTGMIEKEQKFVLDEKKTDKANWETMWIDVVSDLIKWLGYGVLKADFSGLLTNADGLPYFPGLESAWFGVLAALSAQLYADVFFSAFAFGGESKREEILSRNLVQWTTAYLQEAQSAAVLFGVYDLVQIPAKALVSAILSGGADGCYGSIDYDLCLESYLVNNPPQASPEAQFRSLATTLVSLWNRLTLLYQFDFIDSILGQ